MINFKNRDELAPSVLIILSIAILIGSLLFMLLVPKPSVAGLAAGRTRSIHKIEDETDKAKARTKEAETAANPRIWSGEQESVTASVLALLTNQANQRSLKIAAFRPQRTQLLPGLTELPYSVQVSGPYPAVQTMIAALDTDSSKLALRSLQIASADGKTSAVTATLGLSAYVPIKQETSSVPSLTATPSPRASASPAATAGATGETSGGTRG
jgi:hypothetical protein